MSYASSIHPDEVPQAPPLVEHGRLPLLPLTLGALGVVYGDIGTSPLYALREALHAHHRTSVNPDEVLGILSLIFWALIIIVSIKYIIFVLRADYHGEGGILALTTLVRQHMPKARRDLPLLVIMGLFGTALLFGDGMLTPAVSVLSAVEGLNTATPAFKSYVVPLTVLLLMILFLMQRQGTERVGRLFGPVMLVWFLTIGALGLTQIVKAPQVLSAVMPEHAVGFLLHHGLYGFTVLGSVFLVLTGGEALYADLGHFGARPIRAAWYVVVLPCLFLNYFGQGAFLLNNPEAIQDPFFLMVPPRLIYPIVALSTAATIIASQALISGTFSLTMQAVQLGYLPRVRVLHTSEREVGQIYVPFINWALMLACVALVVTFQTSSHLAAAYGVAVTLTMLITTILLYFMMRYGFQWPRWQAAPLCLFFLSIELVFFTGNAIKIPHGGWFPLVIGAAIYLVMSTWRKGRQRITALRHESGVPMRSFVQSLRIDNLHIVDGTAVFLHPDAERVPPALLHNLEHNQVLHSQNLIVGVTFEDRPYVLEHRQAAVEQLNGYFYHVQLTFGYLDRPDVPKALQGIFLDNRRVNPDRCSYFLSRETLLPRAWLFSGMALWREKIFAALSKNAEDATAYFNLPPGRVIEVGTQIEI